KTRNNGVTYEEHQPRHKIKDITGNPIFDFVITN
ncbi:MAG: hypothetical protein RLZZ306_460, partial [Bacteroidota bacterium]